MSTILPRGQAAGDVRAPAADPASGAAPRELRPLPMNLASAPVTVATSANMDLLWPSWWSTGTFRDLGALTDPAVFRPYFSGGQAFRGTWTSPGLYNALNSGTSSTWAIGVRVTGTTRVLFGMDGTNGTATASQFVIEIDGQKLSRRYIESGIVNDGHSTGLLLTFPDTRPHDVRLWSKAGHRAVVVDNGGTIVPIPAPFGGRKRLVIAGDSWTEGTSQAGSAISYAAMLQLAAEWDVAYVGNGATGYVSAGPSYASPFGSSQRLDAMVAFNPDLFVFFGSINDQETSAFPAGTAATATYAALASALPNAKGIILGPQLAGRPWMSAALKAAATAAPNVLTYLYPGEEGWNVPGAIGPADTLHPSAVGAEHYAATILATIRQVTNAHGDTSW